MSTAQTMQPVLDLDAIAPKRATVRIKHKDKAGKEQFVMWEMRNKSELSLSQIKRVEVFGEQCQTMVSDGGPHTVEDAKLLDGWVWELLEIVFYTPLDETVVESLSYDQKLQIFDTFVEVLSGQPDPKVTPRNRATRRTTARVTKK